MLALDMKSRFSVEYRKSELSPVPRQTLFVTVVEISRGKHTLVQLFILIRFHWAKLE